MTTPAPLPLADGDPKINLADWNALVSEVNRLQAVRIGEELGYAERATTDSTTNLADDNAALNANLIAGLSVTVTGTGRPVEIEFFCPVVTHSVLNGVTYGTLMANNARIAYSQFTAMVAGKTGHLTTKRRMVLDEGVSYTFTVAKTLDGGGTGTYYADANTVMFLAVTQR